MFSFLYFSSILVLSSLLLTVTINPLSTLSFNLGYFSTNLLKTVVKSSGRVASMYEH